MSMSARKEPEQEACPNCNAEVGNVEQTLNEPPKLISDSKGIHRRAGSEFNDRLKQIKKGSGRVNSIKHI